MTAGAKNGDEPRSHVSINISHLSWDGIAFNYNIKNLDSVEGITVKHPQTLHRNTYEIPVVEYFTYISILFYIFQLGYNLANIMPCIQSVSHVSWDRIALKYKINEIIRTLTFSGITVNVMCPRCFPNIYHCLRLHTKISSCHIIAIIRHRRYLSRCGYRSEGHSHGWYVTAVSDILQKWVWLTRVIYPSHEWYVIELGVTDMWYVIEVSVTHKSDVTVVSDSLQTWVSLTRVICYGSECHSHEWYVIKWYVTAVNVVLQKWVSRARVINILQKWGSVTSVICHKSECHSHEWYVTAVNITHMSDML